MRCTLSIVVAMTACALAVPLMHDQSHALVDRDLDDDSAVLYRWDAAIASEDPDLEMKEVTSTEVAHGVQIEPRNAGALPDDDNAILYRWNEIEAVGDTTQVE